MLESGFYNMDCMDAMREFPDNFFDLAVVDPPYGSGFTKGGGCQQSFANETRFGGKGSRFAKYRENGVIDWDEAPPQEYFEELFRISKNQIIWGGGNYFQLPSTRCFLIWRKLTISENFTMAMAEYAWTSFNDNAKVFEHTPQDKARFHPTQKPVALYKWILSNYAKEGDKILDTHVGSASSLIACYDMGFEYWGFEIDEEYYKLASERLEEEMAQIRFDL